MRLRRAAAPAPPAVAVSVVIPCLNEAETIAACVRKAAIGLQATGLPHEIIVADNGSTDGAPGIAAEAGARVVHVSERGYGSALMGGIAAARGEWIVMGDADDSYDFREIPAFVAQLANGYDIVQGCRLPSGGGRIIPGAMPRLHRWWGNPMFSRLARWWFGVPVHDVYCGFRAFRKSFYAQLDQRCTGMEFAAEMIVKSALRRARIAEVPITLHRDGRKLGRPHLRTFRDGWRTLRLLLVYSPKWTFLMPGLALLVAGVLGYAIALPGLSIAQLRFDVHTLLFASLAIIAGFQAVAFALLARAFAWGEGLLPGGRLLRETCRRVTLERGLLAGGAAVLAGLVLLGVAVAQWIQVDFGDLAYARTLRWVIPGVTLATLGLQAVFASFFLSLLGLSRK